MPFSGMGQSEERLQLCGFASSHPPSALPKPYANPEEFDCTASGNVTVALLHLCLLPIYRIAAPSRQ